MNVDALFHIPRYASISLDRSELQNEIHAVWSSFASEIAHLMGWRSLTGGVLAERSNYLQQSAAIWFAYAVEGIWPLLLPAELDDTLMALTKFTAIATPLNELTGMPTPNRCGLVIVMAGLRARLDLHCLGQHPEGGPILESYAEQSSHFTLQEIAVLARMSEKSVRNATHTSKKDRLRTRHETGHTVVDAAEALRWLEIRRKFTRSAPPSTR